ncbi:hypothetical protein LF887_21690 [Chryseobacterium sp. MEBOG06]|uniref:hypothetical protein n=1 Tax=unclassified Chryseobacterium TaxID=2593645 RepID=UPI001F224A1B|nr:MULTISPECIES: hypothetical protein [unclassified Chryseobacterium]UKB83590.1 hypothetical protein LF887_21690 [Chryseobacterium sp. MEBOG06]
MKNNKMITVFILLLGSILINAQLDTLNYLKQFEANKANYINKPFSTLLNDMTLIQPKTAWSFSMGRKKTISADSRFKFANKEMGFNNAITLLIKWVDPIERNATEYYEKKNNFYFTNDERVFYGGKIIKDIIVYR